MLAPYFETLADAYAIRSGDGSSLAQLFRTDWGIFSEEFRDPVAFVRDVLGVGEETRFAPKQPNEGIRLEHWSELRREIREVNRFFPESSLSENAISRVFGLLELEVEIDRLYRARIVASASTFTPDEMGAPPAHLASAGRANPVGIPYLYLASDAHTAIAEIKPQVGAEALVCGFVPVRESRMRVLDLVDPRGRVSPFKWASDIADLRAMVPFIEELGRELSTPVQSASASVDYLASQYLCELAKKCGFSGVRYASSVARGVNYAFFDIGSFAGELPLTRYRVTGVDVRSELLAL